MAERMYRGLFVRAADNEIIGKTVVVSAYGNISEEQPLPPRNDLFNHSPTGFEWGYNGSGPAQLALAMLADHFKHQAEALQKVRGQPHLGSRRAHGDEEIDADMAAVLMHQKLKSRLIAGIPRDMPFCVTSTHIDEVLDRIHQEGPR